jgi:hypothetical protein
VRSVFLTGAIIGIGVVIGEPDRERFTGAPAGPN